MAGPVTNARAPPGQLRLGHRVDAVVFTPSAQQAAVNRKPHAPGLPVLPACEHPARVPRRGIARGSWPSLPSWPPLFRAPAAESGEQYSSPRRSPPGPYRAPRARPPRPERFLSAPGGPYLRTSTPVVILHGVNAVYKLAPYELTVTPAANTFDAADARTIAGSLQRRAPRMLWQASNRAPAARTSPPSARPRAGEPHMYSAATVRAYWQRWPRWWTCSVATHLHPARHAPDVYNSLYRVRALLPGVCTDGCRSSPRAGGRRITTPDLDIAVAHFWATT